MNPLADGIYDEDLRIDDTSRDSKYTSRRDDHIVGGLNESFNDSGRHQVYSDVSDNLSGVQRRRLSTLSDEGNAGKTTAPSRVVQGSNGKC